MKNRKLFITLILSLFACLIGAFFTACRNSLTFKTLSVDGTTVYGKVSNDTTEFSFIDEVKTNDNAKFVVTLDIYGIQQVMSKTIPLMVGNNTVYVIEMLDDEPTAVYTVVVRRRPTYDVTFNTNGGSSVERQVIEEDSLATEPKAPMKIGCTFKGWDYDFSKPITQDTVITAIFEAKAEMSNFNFTSTATTCEITGIKNTSATEITIPDYVTSIGDDAFRGCDSLTSITIGNSVTSIGNYAFLNCIKLTSITIPNSVSNIGNYAFYGCSSLTSITIPNSVTSIGNYAFYGCSSLTSITIPNGVTSIGDFAFQNCIKLTRITIPNGATIKTIGSNAFYNCSSLASITIPNSVTSIGNYAFSHCSNLKSITIPDSVTSIGNYTFQNCSSLTSINFKDTSTWYITTSLSSWQNKTGGTKTSVTLPATNATYFKSTYCSYYWYKL